MKKLIFTLFTVCSLAIAANAQTATQETTTNKAAEKEAKAKHKQLQNENIEKALKQVGVSDKELAEFKVILQDASAKGNEIKKDATLSETDKEAKLKANSEDKNARLKALIGEERYKAYNKIRKEQKPAEEAIMAQFKQ